MGPWETAVSEAAVVLLVHTEAGTEGVEEGGVGDRLTVVTGCGLAEVLSSSNRVEPGQTPTRAGRVVSAADGADMEWMDSLQQGLVL